MVKKSRSPGSSTFYEEQCLVIRPSANLHNNGLRGGREPAGLRTPSVALQQTLHACSNVEHARSQVGLS